MSHIIFSAIKPLTHENIDHDDVDMTFSTKMSVLVQYGTDEPKSHIH